MADDDPLDDTALLQATAERLARHLPCATAFVRWPLRDADAPLHGDLDLLVFDDRGADRDARNARRASEASDASEILVERLPATDRLPSLDLMRLPAAWRGDADKLAAFGLVTHRLLASRPLTPQDQPLLATLQVAWQAGHGRRARIETFLEMARITVREVGVSEDHPAIALFWLHMTHAACLAALADAAGQPCPNVYTRPLAVAAALEAEVGAALVQPMVSGLRLDADPSPMFDAVIALRELVASRCPEPAWPAAMRESTRFEYRYWLAPGEIEGRVESAREMARRGQAPAAVFYLRYAAYSLVRAVMIHARVQEGWPHHVPYIRPERRVGPDLAEHLPQALHGFEQVLGGGGVQALRQLGLALRGVEHLREITLAFTARRGFEWLLLPAWAPIQSR